MPWTALSARPLLLALALAAGASAQTSVGAQLGSPTGLSVKLGEGRGALLGAAGWDLGESFGAEGHYVLRWTRLEGGEGRWFYGPGAFVAAGDDDLDLGVSLGVGVEALLARDVEGYALVSPRLQLIDETTFGLGFGVGLRLRLD